MFIRYEVYCDFNCSWCSNSAAAVLLLKHELVGNECFFSAEKKKSQYARNTCHNIILPLKEWSILSCLIAHSLLSGPRMCLVCYYPCHYQYPFATFVMNKSIYCVLLSLSLSFSLCHICHNLKNESNRKNAQYLWRTRPGLIKQ